MARKFTDKKVNNVTIRDFFKLTNFLFGINDHLWQGNNPCIDECYYKVTQDKLVCILYTGQRTLTYDIKPLLDCIIYCDRDGKTEFELFSKKISLLKNKIESSKNKSKIRRDINRLQKTLNWLEQNAPKYVNNNGSFLENNEENYIEIRQPKNDKHSKRYVVLDVETNGLRTTSDDLLSLSLYDPQKCLGYNKFFPLDMQPVVLTTYINGITDEQLVHCKHWTQKEVDELIERFNLSESIVLTYSGGKGNFDKDFLINYCKRHNLVGFENLTFENIKTYLPKTPKGCEGKVTKDNMCSLLKINGVKSLHSSLNDCVLEWNLFDKITSNKYLFIDTSFYEYHEDYIIPVTYLTKYKELEEYSSISCPPLTGTLELLYEDHVKKDCLPHINKFPTNITGIALENIIFKLLNAKRQDNKNFLNQNKSRLKYLGSLDSNYNEVQINIDDQGFLTTTDNSNKEFINDVNDVTKIISSNMGELIKFIKTKLFRKSVTSQELVISEDKKVLAECDISDTQSILEIKTFSCKTQDGYLRPDITKQLYYQSKGRNKYLLEIVFQKGLEMSSRPYEFVLEDLSFKIYKVDIELKELGPRVVERMYSQFELYILKYIKQNPSISQAELCIKIGATPATIAKHTRCLIDNGVIERVGSSRSGYWKILKEIHRGDTFQKVIDREEDTYYDFDIHL